MAKKPQEGFILELIYAGMSQLRRLAAGGLARSVQLFALADAVDLGLRDPARPAPDREAAHAAIAIFDPPHDAGFGKEGDAAAAVAFLVKRARLPGFDESRCGGR